MPPDGWPGPWPEEEMIYTLQVECVFGAYLKEKCIRILEMDEDSSLYDLHNVIQEAVAFGQDHPFEFYIANSPFGWKKRWLTEAEDWEDKVADFLRIHLKDIWPLGRKRLYYWFDFGDRWTFEIRKGRKVKVPETSVTYPRVVEAIGPNPEQHPQFDE